MTEFCNYYEPIQLFMDNVKKDLISKTNNFYNLKNLREILNSLFNLFDYEITLINQIVLFTQNTLQNNSNGSNSKTTYKISNNVNFCNNYNYNYYNKAKTQKNILNHLININKDIMVSMTIKFLTKINSLFNINNDKNKNKYTYNNLNKNSSHGKMINLLNSNSNNNLLFSNSLNSIHTILKNNNNNTNTIKSNSHKSNKNKNKPYNIDYSIDSPRSKNNRTTSTNNISNNYLKKYEDNSTILRTKGSYYLNNINKNNKNVKKNKKNNYEYKYKKVVTDVKSRDNNKKKEKEFHKSNSYDNSNKNIFIDINNDKLKSLFNSSLYYKSLIRKKKSYKKDKEINVFII